MRKPVFVYLARYLAPLCAILGAPGFVLCGTHHCRCGHMQHPPYASWHSMSDNLWPALFVVGAVAAIGFRGSRRFGLALLLAVAIAFRFEDGLGDFGSVFTIPWAALVLGVALMHAVRTHKRNVTAIPAVAMAVALICSCNESTVPPPPAGLVMTATASALHGSPAAPIAIRAVLHNHSSGRYYIMATCQGPRGIYPRVHDADGNRLGSWYSWSNCYHSEWMLEPGDSLAMTRTFDGVLFDDHDVPHALPTGRYSITFLAPISEDYQPARLELDWDAD